MRKIIYLIFIISFTSCESRRDNCIKNLVDNKGYSYDEACDYCNEMEESSLRE
jgi:archaellum biogenesis protein FlaJ (TadC family)